MAGGAFQDTEAAKRVHLYEHRITSYFIFSCIIAASGGALFGYDLGVSGEFPGLLFDLGFCFLVWVVCCQEWDLPQFLWPDPITLVEKKGRTEAWSGRKR